MAIREEGMRIMDENELVNKIESMIDDDEAWGKAGKNEQNAPTTPQRQRSVIVSVRFSPLELTKVQSQAERMGLSVSAYLRTVSLSGTKESNSSDDWFTGFADNKSYIQETVICQPTDVVSCGV